MKRNKLIAIPGKLPATVTQAELQAVIDLQNRVEVLCADVRRRLESGAEFEHGKLGASTWDREPLESIAIGDASQADGFGILDIAQPTTTARSAMSIPSLRARFGRRDSLLGRCADT